jgi:hypothetical protein
MMPAGSFSAVELLASIFFAARFFLRVSIRFTALFVLAFFMRFLAFSTRRLIAGLRGWGDNRDGLCEFLTSSTFSITGP